MMSYLSNCEIVLNRANAVYLSGETVYGSLVFKITQPLKLKSIDLLIDGYTLCSLVKSGTIERYEGYDAHLKSYIYFLPKNKSNDYNFCEGDYNYKFEITLPSSLPSSFKHKSGETSYNLTAVFYKSWSFEKKFTKKLTIIRSIDSSSSFLSPITKWKDHHFGCLCCKSQAVTAIIKLDKDYYAINENIGFKVIINNGSSKDLNGVKVALVKKIFYKPKKDLNALFLKEITSVEKMCHITRGSDFEWADNSIKIPLIEPTDKQELLEITYLIKMIVKTGIFSLDIKVDADINIGLYVKSNENNETKEILFDVNKLGPDPFS